MPANRFNTLTCLQGKQGQDPLLDEVRDDVQCSSVLEAMKTYITQLCGKLDNNARAYQKIARLFDVGLRPTVGEGHHDDVTLGLRTGDEQGLLASYGNFLGFLWGTVVGPVSPWVGKWLHPVSSNLLQNYIDGFERGETPTYLGVNHFAKVEDSVVNALSLSILTFWMHLKDAPQEERDLYGHDKDGAFFIARRAQSVYRGTPRKVFQLNYAGPTSAIFLPTATSSTS